MVEHMSLVVPATPIVELYDELHQKGVSRKQKLARAKQFVADPAPLAAIFHDSVATIAKYTPSDEGFYKSRTHYEVGDVKASSTTDLALRIRDAGGLSPSPSATTPLPDAETLPASGVSLARWGRTLAHGKRDVPAEADIATCDPPVFDAHVVLHNRPHGTHLSDLGVEAERLAALLLGEPLVAQHIRRIACLETTLVSDELCSEARWAYERPEAQA
jgi:hypothetical protein